MRKDRERDRDKEDEREDRICQDVQSVHLNERSRLADLPAEVDRDHESSK